MFRNRRRLYGRYLIGEFILLFIGLPSACLFGIFPITIGPGKYLYLGAAVYGL
jgi:hypothetical protein